ADDADSAGAGRSRRLDARSTFRPTRGVVQRSSVLWRMAAAHAGGAEVVATVALTVVAVDKPADANVILGQAHFIKTVEDLHEALFAAVPGLAFGLAFCESSGPRLVRTSGTDPALTDLAARNARAIGAGHTFVILLGNAYPVNVLNAVKA